MGLFILHKLNHLLSNIYIDILVLDLKLEITDLETNNACSFEYKSDIICANNKSFLQ